MLFQFSAKVCSLADAINASQTVGGPLFRHFTSHELSPYSLSSVSYPILKCLDIYFHPVQSHPSKMVKGESHFGRREAGGGEGLLFKAKEKKAFYSFLQSGLNFLKTSRCFHLAMPFWRFPSALRGDLTLSYQQVREALTATAERSLSRHPDKKVQVFLVMNVEINNKLYFLRTAPSRIDF